MTCEPDTARFEDYLDAALPAIERQELDRHLRTCVRCRSELNKLRALRSLLAELPAPSTAPGALDSILRAAVRPAAASRRRWQDVRWMAAGLATAAVLLIALGIRVGMDLPGAKRAGPEVALAAQPVQLDGGVQQVALLFRATEVVHDADISLWLPQDVQIAGRPRLRHVSWHVDLKAGPNILELPLVATGSHGGTLVVQVVGGSFVRRLEIPISISMRAPRGPGSASRAASNPSERFGA
jgi:hypothetical protein